CKERLRLQSYRGRGGHRYLYYRGRTSHPGSNRHTWILLRPEPGSVLCKPGRERCPWRYLHDNERHASIIIHRWVRNPQESYGAGFPSCSVFLIDRNTGVILSGGFGKLLALFTGDFLFVYSEKRVLGDQVP